MTHRYDIEQLFKAHYAQMYRLAVVLLHDENHARDIVHDVFVSLLDNTPDILVTAGYLLRAVRNRCLNHIRDFGIHQRVANRYLLEQEAYDSTDWPDDETIERIYSLIEGDLSQQARRIMELRFAKGKRVAEIALDMGISQSAVFKHLSHAISFIRKKLNENG